MERLHKRLQPDAKTIFHLDFVKLASYESIYYNKNANVDSQFNCLETTSRSVLIIYPNTERCFELFNSKCDDNTHYL